MFETGEDPETIIQSQGMELIGDESVLTKVADEIIAANEKSVADFKKGKTNALQFLVGQMMAKTKGQADPNIARKILEKKLG
jgi:aspartyl-tRNA(Asn)/glutamyl-tRNA(Gln) amidotransferase subunit B